MPEYGRFFTPAASFPFFASRSIHEGIFNYGEAFSTFIKSTPQKAQTASVFQIFSKELQSKQLSWIEGKPVKVADLGCATSETSLGYLKNMDHEAGVQYWGVDTNRSFLKQADAILTDNPLVKQHILIHGDALDGHLSEKKEFAGVLFDWMIVSHTAYYVENELACRAFLNDAMRLLSERGIAIFLHEGSTYRFRSKYNKRQFANPNSTPTQLKMAAGRLKNVVSHQFESITFTSPLYFDPLDASTWEAMKRPQDYIIFARVPGFTETLEKLAFIVQRDLRSMAEEGCLAEYVDEIREAVINNGNCFELETHMQVMVRPECVLRHEIVQTLIETQRKIGQNWNQGDNKNEGDEQEGEIRSFRATTPVY